MVQSAGAHHLIQLPNPPSNTYFQCDAGFSSCTGLDGHAMSPYSVLPATAKGQDCLLGLPGHLQQLHTADRTINRDAEATQQVHTPAESSHQINVFKGILAVCKKPTQPAGTAAPLVVEQPNVRPLQLGAHTQVTPNSSS